MAKNRTEKSKFQSKYSPEPTYITPAQYIVEIICEHKADHDGKGLAVKFWQDKTWGKFFRQQMTLANGLLKIYSPQAIIAALKRPEAKKVYSLGAKWILDKLFDEEQNKFDARQKKLENAKDTPDTTNLDTTQKPVSFRQNKSKLSKLR